MPFITAGICLLASRQATDPVEYTTLGLLAIEASTEERTIQVSDLIKDDLLLVALPSHDPFEKLEAATKCLGFELVKTKQSKGFEVRGAFEPSRIRERDRAAVRDRLLALKKLYKRLLASPDLLLRQFERQSADESRKVKTFTLAEMDFLRRCLKSDSDGVAAELVASLPNELLLDVVCGPRQKRPPFAWSQSQLSPSLVAKINEVAKPPRADWRVYCRSNYSPDTGVAWIFQCGVPGASREPQVFALIGNYTFSLGNWKRRVPTEATSNKRIKAIAVESWNLRSLVAKVSERGPVVMRLPMEEAEFLADETSFKGAVVPERVVLEAKRLNGKYLTPIQYIDRDGNFEIAMDDALREPGPTGWTALLGKTRPLTEDPVRLQDLTDTLLKLDDQDCRTLELVETWQGSLPSQYRRIGRICRLLKWMTESKRVNLLDNVTVIPFAEIPELSWREIYDMPTPVVAELIRAFKNIASEETWDGIPTDLKTLRLTVFAVKKDFTTLVSIKPIAIGMSQFDRVPVQIEIME